MKYYFRVALLLLPMIIPFRTDAFCGFYVSKADARLFNKASKVVVAHSDNRNVVTMASDYEGDPKEFAVVIPVPVVISKEQVHITENTLVDHVDAYTAPRLVEYHDPDPCPQPYQAEMKSDMAPPPPPMMAMAAAPAERAAALGVKIEAEYSVGEYDIQILSAKQSDGLETWLKETGYKIPDGASIVLGSYIKQDMKFFVAKVNLKEQEKLGFHFLRPIQVAYEASKFMLPIRLGTVNADGAQDLFIFMLTQQGRVETTNYRTVKIPTGINIPLFTKSEFGDVYKDMFSTQVKKEDMRAVFLEYAWNMGSCDPCSADPIPNDKLIELGAFWLVQQQQPMAGRMAVTPMIVSPSPVYYGNNGTFITRLHVRYDRAHFPEDLMFEETSNQESFQGRYVLNYPWMGKASCPAGIEYKHSLPDRFAREAENLAELTGWEMDSIRSKMESHGQSFDPAKAAQPLKWYQQIWKQP